MLLPLSSYFGGKRYTLVPWRSPDSSEGRRLSAHEACELLARMMRDDAAMRTIRQLYIHQSGRRVSAPLHGDVVLRWVKEQLSDRGVAQRLVLIEHASTQRRREETVDVHHETARRMDKVIARLGQTELFCAGECYRIRRAGSSAKAPLSSVYETLSEHESVVLVQQMAQQPHLAPAQKTALTELLDIVAQAHAQQRKSGLLLLRRERHYARPGPEPEVITPSRLRRKKNRVDLVLVEEWGNAPKGTFSHKLAMQDGTVLSGSFSADGKAQHTDLDVESGLLTLQHVHPDEWRLRGARPVGWLRKGLHLTVADPHGVPYKSRKFEATFDNGSTISGEMDESGVADVAESPSYPLLLKLPDFDVEDWD